MGSRLVLLAKAALQWLWLRLLRAIKRPINWPATLLFVYGFPGHMDDGAAWVRWSSGLAAAIANSIPYVGGVTAMDAAAIITNDWVRAGAVALALALFQAHRIRGWIRGFKEKAEYVMATSTGGQNFIPEERAIDIVARSQWGQSRQARSKKPSSLGELLSQAMAQHNPEETELRRMFRVWCKKALERFELEKGGTTTDESRKKMYDEVILREWLTDQYDGDIYDAFGPA